MPEAPDDHAKLVEEIEQRYPRYGKWEFSYEHPGFFGYYLQGTKLAVFFTPDNDEPNVISIQVDDDGRDIDGGEVPFTKRTVENLFRAVSPWLDKHEKGRLAGQKGKTKEKWIIKWTGPDSSRDDSTVAYDSREKAIKAAADWVKQQADEELNGISWDEEDENPVLLKDILRDVDEGNYLDAVRKWLDYQGDFDPQEKMSIGPSGFVSDNSSDLS